MASRAHRCVHHVGGPEVASPSGTKREQAKGPRLSDRTKPAKRRELPNVAAALLEYLPVSDTLQFLFQGRFYPETPPEEGRAAIKLFVSKWCRHASEWPGNEPLGPGVNAVNTNGVLYIDDSMENFQILAAIAHELVHSLVQRTNGYDFASDQSIAEEFAGYGMEDVVGDEVFGNEWPRHTIDGIFEQIVASGSGSGSLHWQGSASETLGRLAIIRAGPKGTKVFEVMGPTRAARYRELIETGTNEARRRNIGKPYRT